jgi:periplasmic copper chaperone A
MAVAHRRRNSLVILAIVALLPMLVVAHSYTAGALKIGHPWSRATPPGAQVAVGFLTIANTGQTDDRLLRLDSPVAERVEIHQMTMAAGMMRMRRLDDGLALAAGKTVTLAPGGYHLMFIRPSRAFVAGDRIKATLVFRDAGKVAVEFAVGDAGATMPAMPPSKTNPHAGH